MNHRMNHAACDKLIGVREIWQRKIETPEEQSLRPEYLHGSIRTLAIRLPLTECRREPQKSGSGLHLLPGHIHFYRNLILDWTMHRQAARN
jgi:hypothetical protein